MTKTLAYVPGVLKPEAVELLLAVPVAPNLLQRQFAAGDINQRWVSDMTYIWTGEGCCIWR